MAEGPEAFGWRLSGLSQGLHPFLLSFLDGRLSPVYIETTGAGGV